MLEILECPDWPLTLPQSESRHREQPWITVKKTNITHVRVNKMSAMKKIIPFNGTQRRLFISGCAVSFFFDSGIRIYPSYVFTSEGCIKIGRSDGLGPEQKDVLTDSQNRHCKNRIPGSTHRNDNTLVGSPFSAYFSRDHEQYWWVLLITFYFRFQTWSKVDMW